MLGACGSCQWVRSTSRRKLPVACRLCISPCLCGNYLGVSNIRSRDYRGRAVVVARCHCPDLGGRRCAVTISGVAGVACHVRHHCPSLWSLVT